MSNPRKNRGKENGLIKTLGQKIPRTKKFLVITFFILLAFFAALVVWKSAERNRMIKKLGQFRSQALTETESETVGTSQSEDIETFPEEYSVKEEETLQQEVFFNDRIYGEQNDFRGDGGVELSGEELEALQEKIKERETEDAEQDKSKQEH